ncbi:caspase family protein [Flammeovirgaceae bacterium SG7u.111]|nr:caspase family protein [Flammeovirgaceae bacterium SG7u.132]WPO37333.1 caspase family protein [Flammeovirgaceae bacterium SG7u.111]
MKLPSVVTTRNWLVQIAVLLFCCSCATIFSGTTQKVRIKSDPKNARVFINGKDSGVNTNGKVIIRRAIGRTEHNNTNEQTYIIKKAGYEDAVIRDRRTINGWALAGDLLFFGIPLIPDFLNGSIYHYRRNIRVDMVPISSAPGQTVLAANKKEKPEITLPLPVLNQIEEFSEELFKDIPTTQKINHNAIAIVIGNKNYEGKDIPNVDWALNDSRLMKEYLIKSFGFREGNVIYIEDADLGDFYRVFGNKNNYKARLYNLVKPDESDVFIYYTGHGAPDVESHEGYLVPVDCEDVSLLEFEGFSLDILYQNLSKIPYRSLTFVADACFSGNTQNGGALIKSASPVYVKALTKLLSDENTYIMTSSRNDQVASWYDEKKHSLFTYYFLKGLKGEANTDQNEGALSFKELRDYLEENIPYMARSLHNRSQFPELFGQNDKVLLEY